MISLILTIAIIGAIVWAIVTYIPMPQAFKTAIIIIVLVCLIIYLMGVFGVADLPVPKVR